MKASRKSPCTFLHMDQCRSFREGSQAAAQLISAVQNHSKRLSQLTVHIRAGNGQPLQLLSNVCFSWLFRGKQHLTYLKSQVL